MRTFTHHVYFQDRMGEGQQSLFNVLKCYSLHDQECGYVQGMGYLGAILLMYMGAEDAFKSLVGLCKSLRDYYLPGMPGLSKSGYTLLVLTKKFMSKVHHHMLD